MLTLRVAAGQTTPGHTDWQVYGTNSISVTVDTSAAKFTTTPVYITSIGGSGQHWMTTGASAVYEEKSTSFRIFIKYIDGRELTPAQANAEQWHINWIGKEL